MGEFHGISDFTVRSRDRVTTSDPTINDDASAGYTQTSHWYNTTTKRLWICYSALVGAAWWQELDSYSSYGSEVDGLLTFDGTSTVNGWAPDGSGVYTATSPIVCSKLTLLNSSRLKMNNHFFDCSWLYTTVGTSVDWDGTDANGITGGAAVSASGTIFAATGGGGNGRNTTGVGASGSGSGGSNITGASGGAGGEGDPGNAGGAGNMSAALNANIAKSFYRAGFSQVMRFWNGNAFQACSGGGGGGGGGCVVGTGTATSGAGSGAGGVGYGRVGKWEVYGRVTSRGGRASAASGITGNGKGGGGGGGSGGALHLECDEVVSMGTVDCAGGGPGNGGGGAPPGISGTPGLVVFLKTQKG